MIVQFENEIFDLSDREQMIDYAIKRWQPRINNLANKFSNPVCGVDDLIQEAKMKVVHAADLWDPDHPSKTTWDTYAFAAIKNAILEAYTRNNYAMSIPSGSIDADTDTTPMRASKLTDEVADFRGDPKEFLDICDTLEEFDHYRVGEMYFVEGRTMHEIADLTQIPRSTVARYINRMKELLKARLTV